MSEAKKLHVKTGDTVMIMSGKDKGLSGKVLATSPKDGVEAREAPPAGPAGRHCEGRKRHVRLQGDAGVPQVPKTRPRRPSGG